MAFDQETQARYQLAIQKGMDPQRAARAAALYQARKSTTLPQETREGLRITDILPSLGGIAGGVIGTVGGPAGAVVGSSAGSVAGEGLRQIVTGERDAGRLATEGALGLAGGVGGEVLGAGLRVGSRLLGRGVAEGTEVGARKLSTEAVGRGLQSVGDNLAIKTTRANTTQLRNFQQQHREDLAQTMKRHKIIGNDSGQIYEKALTPLQKSFDDIADRSDVLVSRELLDKNFYKPVKVLLESGDLDDKALAQKMLDQYDSIVGNRQSLPIKEVNRLRKNFDAKVKDWKRTNPLVASEKRLIGGALRESAQDAAEAAGLKGPAGQSLREIGLELNKLYDVHNLVGLQENLGRGNLPIGLTTLLGAGGGAIVGDVSGAATGYLALRTLNSPGAIALGSRGATALGSRLARPVTTGTRLATSGTGQVTSQTALRAILQQSGALQPEMEVDTPGLDLVNEVSQTTRPRITDEQLAQVLIADLATNKGKNFEKILAIGKLLSGTGSKRPKLSDTAIKSINDTQSALASLDQLEQLIGQNELAIGPVIGSLQAAIPGSGTQKLRADIDRIRQTVGKALEGGVLRKEDEEKYKKILPTINDTQGVARYKIRQLKARINTDLQNYIALQSQVGGGQSTALQELLNQVGF